MHIEWYHLFELIVHIYLFLAMCMCAYGVCESAFKGARCHVYLLYDICNGL